VPVAVEPRRASLPTTVARSLLRPGGDPSGLAHSGTNRSMLVVVAVVELVPTALLSLVIPGVWKIVHLVAEVVLILFLLGLAATWRSHPHTVGPEALRVRTGLTPELVVPLAAVAAVRREELTPKGSGLRLVEGEPDALACSAAEVNVVVELTEPFEHRGALVRRIRFQADEPARAVRAIAAAR
jgi:hypothetical protein